MSPPYYTLIYTQLGYKIEIFTDEMIYVLMAAFHAMRNIESIAMLLYSKEVFPILKHFFAQVL